MISMEGAARIDTILSVYRRLHEEGGSEMAHVGITIQARMHRSARSRRFDRIPVQDTLSQGRLSGTG